MREFKADRHELRAWSIIVVVIVFHGWFDIFVRRLMIH
jgi:hypothetical protein